MKHGKLRKLLALVLVLCMSVSLVVPAYAAGGSSSAHSAFGRSLIQSWNSFWDKLFGGSDDAGDADLTLVEDETTVETGTALRASTYALDTPSAQADTTTLKYFPVTLYDYEATTINNATHQAEVDAGLGSTWNGIYFSSGAPAAESYSYVSNDGKTTAWKPVALSDVNSNDTYVIVGYRGQALTGQSASITGVATGYSGGAVIARDTNAMGSATKWKISMSGSRYQISTTISNSTRYMTIGNNTGTLNSNSSDLTITGTGAGDNSVYIGTGTYWLNQYGGANNNVYKGWNGQDNGSKFYIYKLQTFTGTAVTTNSLSYAAWNWWNKNTGDNDNGQYTYSGLVNSTLDANKNIRFTKPDGGIFNDDATVKTIYTNVDMPFVYEGGTYTFDASQNGAYFYADNSQGSTKAQSNGRLYFNEGNPQSNGGSYGDGSTTVWMPFNSTQNIGSEASCNYHFGMAATIPFTMTANGKMNPNDEDSEDITFSFSGDDDVWVFIDGQLVIDLGGIHNRLDATINFAENTWSLSKSNTVNVAVADYNNAAISGKIFNEGNTTGTLNQTRETFAAKDSHELTIFYLERGAGSSNCKIQFNLPMKDTVSVTKRATQSISSDGTVSSLTTAEQKVVDNIDFGFTLTKNGTPVANTNYNLMNANGQVISTPATDANGHFTLRNGQTARFVGEIAADGAEYQVVEDAVDTMGFKLPTYTYTGTAAGGFTVSSTSYSDGSAIPSTAKNLTSAAVTAKGSDEAEDSLGFVCENYFDANLPNPSSRPVDDQIVIDYGLPVVIDVLANDVYHGDKIELTEVTGAQYGEAKIENGKIKYQLTKQLTGVEVLTYTARVTGTGNSGDETTTASESKTAKVYIIPATSMYYEENFSDLVTFSDGWSDVGTAQTDPQEPGVVGTPDDSPYGSDAAYRNDSGDSNGSSKYVNTTNGAASFSYTFTGTGTSFFARTTNNSGYMRVVITEDGEEVYQLRRDTSFKTEDNKKTLYNIPVFTWEAENYGTYEVTVTIATQNKLFNFGNEFWLDGIRVVKPLDSTDQNASVAASAYAADGEANMTVATLRQKIIQESMYEDENGYLVWDGENFVIFTDTNGEIQLADEYRSNGPKEEVYLNEGQSVSFSLTNWDPNTNKIYLGIKAPTGSGTVSINGNTLNINNAADCYYDISNFASITEGEDGVNTATFKITATSSLISVTNIKVTGKAEFTIVNQEDPTVDGGEGEQQ